VTELRVRQQDLQRAGRDQKKPRKNSFAHFDCLLPRHLNFSFTLNTVALFSRPFRFRVCLLVFRIQANSSLEHTSCLSDVIINNGPLTHSSSWRLQCRLLRPALPPSLPSFLCICLSLIYVSSSVFLFARIGPNHDSKRKDSSLNPSSALLLPHLIESRGMQGPEELHHSH
jgi:hypothetical protein